MIDAVEEDASSDDVNHSNERVKGGGVSETGGGGEGEGEGVGESEGKGGVVKGLGFADCFDVHHDVRALVLEVCHPSIDLLLIDWLVDVLIDG